MLTIFFIQINVNRILKLVCFEQDSMKSYFQDFSLGYCENKSWAYSWFILKTSNTIRSYSKHVNS